MVSGRQIRPALIRWVVLAKRKAGRMGLGGLRGGLLRFPPAPRGYVHEVTFILAFAATNFPFFRSKNPNPS